MHHNTENRFRINYSNTMFNFLLDILPLESGEKHDDEEEGGKSGSGNIVDEKIAFITESIQRDKVSD